MGQPVTISGAGVSGYNGTFTVTSLPGGSTGTTFTYTDSNTSLANSGGGTATLARGIPISISGPTGGVTSGQFTLTYTASDLSISGALVDPTLAASYGATLVAGRLVHGGHGDHRLQAPPRPCPPPAARRSSWAA